MSFPTLCGEAYLIYAPKEEFCATTNSRQHRSIDRSIYRTYPQQHLRTTDPKHALQNTCFNSHRATRGVLVRNTGKSFSTTQLRHAGAVPRTQRPDSGSYTCTHATGLPSCRTSKTIYLRHMVIDHDRLHTDTTFDLRSLSIW